MRILERNLKRTCFIVQEMWRHRNTCWKWPPFGSRQDWTRRAIFGKSLPVRSLSLPEFLRRCLLSRRLWFAVCFGKLSLSYIPIRNNRTAWDRESVVAKVPSKWRGRRRRTEFRPCWREKCGMSLSSVWSVGCGSVLCEVWDVAPSYWKYPIESCSSSKWFTKVLKISIHAERRVRQETGWLAGGPLLRVATIRRTADTHTTDTHYRHIPLHFSHNERTPVQISLQCLHWCWNY